MKCWKIEKETFAIKKLANNTHGSGGEKVRVFKRFISIMMLMCLTICAMTCSTSIPAYAAGTWAFYGGGWYKLYPKCANGKCLDVSNASKSNGANIQLYEQNRTEAQWFYFADLGNGYYTIVSKCSGKVLDVSDRSDKSGANVQQWDYAFGNNQIWKVEPAGDGYYYIKPSNNESLALDVSNAADENGANVQVYDHSRDNSAQMWKLWNNNTSVTYSSVSGIKETYQSKAVTYYVNPYGDSKVTVWAVDNPLTNNRHYKKEGASRFRVRIVSDWGDVIKDSVVSGECNTFSVESEYGSYRVEVTKYTGWADDFMWTSNFGDYCQVSLSNAEFR